LAVAALKNLSQSLADHARNAASPILTEKKTCATHAKKAYAELAASPHIIQHLELAEIVPNGNK